MCKCTPVSELKSFVLSSLRMSLHLCVYASEFVLSPWSLLSRRVSVWSPEHIKLPGVRGTSFTQRRSKRRRQSASRFRPLRLWHQEMGLNLMEVWFFFSPRTAFYLPKLWIVIITHQVNRQHQCTDYTGQELIERDVGKGKGLWQEWLSHWWVTDDIFSLRRTRRRLIILTA